MATVTRAEPLYNQIYEILWQNILAGELPVGGRLRDVEWANRLNVSRTPVREALRKLQQDGILEPLAGGGYVLREMGASDLRQLYRCRAVLEALAVREAADRLSQPDFDLLSDLIERTEHNLQEKRFHDVFVLNTQFHDHLIASSGNKYVSRLIADLRRQILYARSSLKGLIDENPELTSLYLEHLFRDQAYHREIVQRLAGTRADAAGQCMEAHLFETGDAMRTIMECAGVG